MFGARFRYLVFIAEGFTLAGGIGLHGAPEGVVAPVVAMRQSVLHAEAGNNTSVGLKEYLDKNSTPAADLRAFHRAARSSLRRDGAEGLESKQFDTFMRFFDGRCLALPVDRTTATWFAVMSPDSRCLFSPASAEGQQLTQDKLSTMQLGVVIHRTLHGSAPFSSQGEEEVESKDQHIVSERHESSTGSVTQLDWPTITSIMEGIMSMNGFKGREEADARKHQPFPHMSFSERYDNARLHSDVAAMQSLVQDLVLYLGGAVTATSGLNDFASQYQGSDQDFHSMTEALMTIGNTGKGWLRFGGEFAVLNKFGYAALLRYTDSGVIEPFIRRVITSLGLTVTSEEALQVFLRFYDNECGAHDYDILVSELQASATSSPFCGGGWLAKKADADV